MAPFPSHRGAVVTAFCAAHTMLQTVPSKWVEYSSNQQPRLKDLCSGESRQTGQDPHGWWERFFACGIIGALESAQLWHEERLALPAERVAVCFASSKGRPAQWEAGGSYFENSCDWAVREVLRVTGARGKTLCPVAACASGSHAIALAAQWIEDDLADVVLCGATEAELASLVLAGYQQLGALSKSGVMRPFDVRRDGFVPAPGAACLVLENEKSARARRTKVLGRVSGWSLSCDATALTAMDASGESIARATRQALMRSGREIVGYVNAHGTATAMNDEIEARALHKVLGARVPVSSTKAMTGHMLGAAGAVEAVLGLMAMEEGFAPPTLNLEQPDETCAIDIIGTAGRDCKIESVLSLSYGFGGHIGALVLEKELP